MRKNQAGPPMMLNLQDDLCLVMSQWP